MVVCKCCMVWQGCMEEEMLVDWVVAWLKSWFIGWFINLLNSLIHLFIF